MRGYGRPASTPLQPTSGAVAPSCFAATVGAARACAPKPAEAGPRGRTLDRQRRTSMVDWFEMLAARSELPADAASELQHRGFIVLPGLVPPEQMEQLTDAYTVAMSSASGPDLRVGSTSTRSAIS
jgi:hypothetical protein